MKLNNIKQVDKFLEILKDTRGDIWIEAKNLLNGETTMRLDLKSFLSRYVALGELIKASRDPGHMIDLELYCQSSEDKAMFYKFFVENEDTI